MLGSKRICDDVQNGSKYPVVFATSKCDFGGHAVLARVEWHPPDFQNQVEHRGVPLYEATVAPLPAPPPKPVPNPPELGPGIRHRRFALPDGQRLDARGSRGGSFVFIKATEGNTFVDPTFSAHWADAQKANVLRAPYHFFRP
jgi:Glycosyl hydrolases family 25